MGVVCLYLACMYMYSDYFTNDSNSPRDMEEFYACNKEMIGRYRVRCGANNRNKKWR